MKPPVPAPLPGDRELPRPPRLVGIAGSNRAFVPRAPKIEAITFPKPSAAGVETMQFLQSRILN